MPTELMPYIQQFGIGGIFLMLLIKETSLIIQNHLKKKNGKWVDMDRLSYRIDKLYDWHAAGNTEGINAITIANSQKELIQRQIEIGEKQTEILQELVRESAVNKESRGRIEDAIRRIEIKNKGD